MFTGIVEELGEIVGREPGEVTRLTIRGSLVTGDARPGDSIAVNGVCLTVTGVINDTFTVDVVAETLARSSLGRASAVNLERAVTPATRLGGHLVQGHVDGVATVDHVAERGAARIVGLRVPDAVRAVCIPLGSITVDGVSLTVDGLPGPWLVQISLIPFTRDHTTLGDLAPGHRVHVEGDMIAKYVRQLCRSEP